MLLKQMSLDKLFIYITSASGDSIVIMMVLFHVLREPIVLQQTVKLNSALENAGKDTIVLREVLDLLQTNAVVLASIVLQEVEVQFQSILVTIQVLYQVKKM